MDEKLNSKFAPGAGSLWRWGGLALALAIVAGVVVAGRVAANQPLPADAPGVAVVELFTSEGCSSCPPADAFLAELAAQARENGVAVFPLSFHVDYWNTGGWKDPYSSPAHTARQRDYATHFGADRIYTPQMIVNGATEFVGSDRKTANGAIRTALQSPPSAKVALKTFFARDQWQVEYGVTGAPENAALNVAIVAADRSQAVARGENAGRTIRHGNVVEHFKSVPLAAGAANGVVGLGGMDSPAKDRLVIAYVQDTKTRRVLGAASAALDSAEKTSTLNDSTSNESTSLAKGTSSMTDNKPKMADEWKKALSPEQARVMCNEGTERAFTGKYWNTKDEGTYLCAACGQELFSSETKFDSGTGWPSYWKPVEDKAVGTKVDHTLGMARTEVHCSRCGGHLGHVFDDGPNPTGLRYCINSISLDFKPAEK